MFLTSDGGIDNTTPILISCSFFVASVFMSKFWMHEPDTEQNKENWNDQENGIRGRLWGNTNPDDGRRSMMDWYIEKKSYDRLSFSNLSINLSILNSVLKSDNHYVKDQEDREDLSIDASESNTSSSGLEEMEMREMYFQGHVDHFEPHPDGGVEKNDSQNELLLRNHHTTYDREVNHCQNQHEINFRTSRLKKKYSRQSKVAINPRKNLDKLLEGEDIRKGCADDGDSFNSSFADDMTCSPDEDSAYWRKATIRKQRKTSVFRGHTFSTRSSPLEFKEGLMKNNGLQNHLGDIKPIATVTVSKTIPDNNCNISLESRSNSSDNLYCKHQTRLTASLEGHIENGTSRLADFTRNRSNCFRQSLSAHCSLDRVSQSLPFPSSLRRRTSSFPDLTPLETSSFPPAKVRENTIHDADQLIRYQSRAARVNYNASIMPNRIILIRHGQSMGNVNELLYSTTPDNAMPLTNLGWEQAREAGRFLKDLFKSGSEDGLESGNGNSRRGVHFVLSPYVRTIETFHGIASAWCNPKDEEFLNISDPEKRLAAWYSRLVELGLTWQEDPRIREQDFGNYQEPDKIKKAKKDRHRFGAFYYRFPHGESASDVFDRVSTFLDSLWRSFDTNKSRNYVLVTHGISIRIILARYFRYTIDQFHLLANPRNCEMVALVHNGAGRLELGGRYELDATAMGQEQLQSDDDDGAAETAKHSMKVYKSKTTTVTTTGYRYHKRLRVLPRRLVPKVTIRMCEDG